MSNCQANVVTRQQKMAVRSPSWQPALFIVFVNRIIHHHPSCHAQSLAIQFTNQLLELLSTTMQMATIWKELDKARVESSPDSHVDKSQPFQFSPVSKATAAAPGWTHQLTISRIVIAVVGTDGKRVRRIRVVVERRARRCHRRRGTNSSWRRCYKDASHQRQRERIFKKPSPPAFNKNNKFRREEGTRIKTETTRYVAS